MKLKITLIVFVLALLPWPVLYFTRPPNTILVRGLGIPLINDNVPQYSIELSQDSEIRWEHHPITDVVHVVTDRDGRLMDVKFINTDTDK